MREGSGRWRRIRSGAGSRARWRTRVTDPFGQGPLPWLRGSEHYFDDPAASCPGTWTPPSARRRSARARAPQPAQRPAHRRRRRTARSRASPRTGAVGPRRGHRLPRHRRPAPAVQHRRLPHRPLRRRRRAARSPPAPACPASSSRPRSPPTAPSPATTGGCPGASRSPRYWSIGAYVAVLTTADGRYRSHIPFTVRDNRARRPAPAAARHHLAGVQPLPGGRPHRRQPLPRLGRGGPAARRGGRRRHRLLRPPLRGRRAARCTSATPTTSSAGPSATATTSPTPTPAICTPAASTPPATAAWSSPATTSTGRCRCAAPWSAPATTAPRWSSCPPTPCTGRWSSPRRPSAAPTGC